MYLYINCKHIKKFKYVKHNRSSLEHNGTSRLAQAKACKCNQLEQIFK